MSWLMSQSIWVHKCAKHKMLCVLHFSCCIPVCVIVGEGGLGPGAGRGRSWPDRGRPTLNTVIQVQHQRAVENKIMRTLCKKVRCFQLSFYQGSGYGYFFSFEFWQIRKIKSKDPIIFKKLDQIPLSGFAIFRETPTFYGMDPIGSWSTPL